MQITIRHLRAPALDFELERSNPIILGIASCLTHPRQILAIT